MSLLDLYKKAFKQGVATTSDKVEEKPFRKGHKITVVSPKGNCLSIDAEMMAIETKFELPGNNIPMNMYRNLPVRYFVKLHKDQHEIDIDFDTYTELVEAYEATITEL